MGSPTMLGEMASRRNSGSAWLTLIGLFKLVKAISLLIVGIGLLKLLHRDVEATVLHWVEMLRVDPENRYIHRALLRIFNVTPKQLKELSVGTFVYAGLFLTEGLGLLSHKPWAEYLTLVTTGLFIPLELFEIAEHFTWAKVAITLINALIVIYLAARLKRR